MGTMTNDHGSRDRLVQWTALTIDCPEPTALADFYAALLDGKITRRTAESAFVDADGLLLVFRAAPDYKRSTWPSPDVPLHSTSSVSLRIPRGRPSSFWRSARESLSTKMPVIPI